MKFILIAYIRHQPFNWCTVTDSVLQRSAVRLEGSTHLVEMQCIHDRIPRLGRRD